MENLNEIYMIKPSEFEISLTVEIYDEEMSIIDEISMMPKSPQF